MLRKLLTWRYLYTTVFILCTINNEKYFWVVLVILTHYPQDDLYEYLPCQKGGNLLGFAPCLEYNTSICFTDTKWQSGWIHYACLTGWQNPRKFLSCDLTTMKFIFFTEFIGQLITVISATDCSTWMEMCFDHKVKNEIWQMILQPGIVMGSHLPLLRWLIFKTARYDSFGNCHLERP